jgi:predicted nucleotidyltransferase
MIQKHNIFSVAEIFFAEPIKSHYLREISKKSKISPVSVNVYLNKLLKNNIITKTYEIKGKRKYPIYLSNLNAKEYFSFKKISNLINITNSGIIDFLYNLVNPNCIVLFGSYFRGEDTETSDIDIFIQSKIKDINICSFEKKLKRKIQLIFNEDFDSYPNELKNNIINGIVLKGYLEAFK